MSVSYEETKQCPFCGSDDLYVSQISRHYWNIGCNECRAEMTHFANEEEAIKAWNMRIDYCHTCKQYNHHNPFCSAGYGLIQDNKMEKIIAFWKDMQKDPPYMGYAKEIVKPLVEEIIRLKTQYEELIYPIEK